MKEKIREALIIENEVVVWKYNLEIVSEKYLDFLLEKDIITLDQFMNSLDAGDNEAQEKRRMGEQQ